MRAFTLLELLVLLFILGLISMFLTIRIESVFSGGDLRLASRIIIGEINKLRGKAAYMHKEQVLGIRVGQNAIYPIESNSDEQEPLTWRSEEKTEELKAAYLPRGVTFEDVVILSEGKVQEGEARIRFFANGSVERSLIHLRNENDKAYTLQINPLTGQVEIHDTYIEKRMSK